MDRIRDVEEVEIRRMLRRSCVNRFQRNSNIIRSLNIIQPFLKNFINVHYRSTSNFEILFDKICRAKYVRRNEKSIRKLVLG